MNYINQQCIFLSKKAKHTYMYVNLKKEYLIKLLQNELCLKGKTNNGINSNDVIV